MQALGHSGFGVGVQGGGRLNEDQGWGLREQGPGQGHPLTLTPGQGEPLLRDHARQPCVQGRKHIRGVGHLQGRQQPLIALQAVGLGADLLVDVGDPGALLLGAHQVGHSHGHGARSPTCIERLTQGAGEQLGGGAGNRDGGAHLPQAHLG